MNHPAPTARTQPARLVLISPVPTMKTGTGNYLGLLVGELLSGGCKNITVVTNLQQLPDSIGELSPSGLALRLFGPAATYVAVVDYRCFKEDPTDFCVYFAANNEFHHHVYDLLGRPPRALRWLVLHEPSCLMYAIHYFGSRTGVDGPRALQQHLYAQYGPASEGLFDDISHTGIAESLIHESFGFDWYSFGAETIIVHSTYAKQKLLYELCSTHPQPNILVRHHPPEPCVKRIARQRRSSLIFGVFGFINPSKRVNEIIGGFAAFIEAIGAHRADALGLQLRIVGEQPRKQIYDPVGRARELRVERWTRFHGYVTKEAFEQLLDECDTIFNLRFPSCGETTGLAAFLRPGLHIAVSDYHAFREVGADYLIPPGWEEAGVKDVMLKRHAAWAPEPTPLQSAPKNRGTSDVPCVTAEILKGLHLVPEIVS